MTSEETPLIGRAAGAAQGPPLSLYVHLPWCLRKCPYCDFNSHALSGEAPEQAYVAALLQDLEKEAATLPGRVVETLFIGGGTPSLFSGEAIAALLEGIGARLPLAANAEITLEANPGAADISRFRAYRQAGVNRLSIGVQSFDDAMLRRLGRIHDAHQARAAFAAARAAGFDNINLDLMFGLPEQERSGALEDLEQVLALRPEHLSWYQLTLEPNTLFHRQPPPLPADDHLWAMQEAGLELLQAGGYARYEISAFALEGRRCRHNLNYWRFGDYIGIGAGAHGKLTRGGAVLRYYKERHPERYLREPRRKGERIVAGRELALEFLMNVLRLVEGVDEPLFAARTGLPLGMLEPALSEAREMELLEAGRLQATPRGMDFMNDLLLRFDHE